jgi:mannitol/fructose-specific phosphotransferase system IIA component (Ntr-type)
MATTGIGNRVAIPHGKDASVERLVMAVGTSRKGIEFESVDGQPVHVVFLVLASINNPGPHIQALSEIAQKIRMPGFVESMLAAESASDVLTILRPQS